MRIELPTIEGRFVRRYKRFFVDVLLANGETIVAHCPNTGSLAGCLVEGARVVLRDSQNDARKLRYVFQAIEVGRTLVNVDTSLPNHVVFEAVERGKLPELTGYARVEREKKYGKASRIDLLLTGKKGELCYVEVKNTTYAIGTCARFPDAVTERGLKHLDELGNMVERGHRSVQFFFVSRADCREFRPADEIDPAYAAGLRRATKRGVEVLAYDARVAPDRLEIRKRLPVQL
ncbi:MAG: DNA/RNA nuclease SfsA [Planctomycetes bacterium]|nr:DNA/RNA nuclease SfsA [Planctomycetota bacterium]